MPVTVDEMMRDFSPKRRAKIEREAAEIIAESRTLAQLRRAADMTQQALARALRTSQANISEIENKDDALVSTVARVVEGIGGKLRLYVEMPDGSQLPLRLTKIWPAKSRRAKHPREMTDARAAPVAKRNAKSKHWQPPGATAKARGRRREVAP
ncbi:MAG: helix-turn-helix domain-containing protein [Hyphomicrobiales bacterium]